MTAPQVFEVVPVDTLLLRVRNLRAHGCRLVQIGATALGEQLELNYTFDKDGAMTNLRLHVPAADGRVPSISSIYWCAFIYENEIHDLFKLEVTGMAVDFQGKFYSPAVQHAFHTVKVPVIKAPVIKSAPAPAPTAKAAPAAPASTPAQASAYPAK